MCACLCGARMCKGVCRRALGLVWGGCPSCPGTSAGLLAALLLGHIPGHQQSHLIYPAGRRGWAGGGSPSLVLRLCGGGSPVLRTCLRECARSSERDPGCCVPVCLWSKRPSWPPCPLASQLPSEVGISVSTVLGGIPGGTWMDTGSHSLCGPMAGRLSPVPHTTPAGVALPQASSGPGSCLSAGHHAVTIGSR